MKAFFFASVLKAQTPLGPAFLVNPESVGAQDNPDLQFDGAGRLWFVWTDLIGLEPESDRVMARALSPQGELGPTSVLVDTSDIPVTPALAPLIAPLHDPSGGFMLFYSRSDADGFDRVYGQPVSATGELVGKIFKASPPPPSSAGVSAATSLPQGGFFLLEYLVPCADCTDAPVNVDGLALRVDGSPATPYFQVQRNRRKTPVLGVRGSAVDGQGNIVVVWGGV
ncbi:MAG: hypothetical protein DMF53_24350, partial [Acidobacteria bacterium]